jgi:putative DNA primase/helicase
MTTATRPPRPKILPPNRDLIPPELAERRQWVPWRLAWREGTNGTPGKWTKEPINPHTGTLASTTDPATWGTIDEAFAAMKRYRLDGVGYVFSADDPYAGVDQDDCVDLATHAIAPEAEALATRLGSSYTEHSVSGTGLHTIVRATLPPGGNRKGRIEAYDRGRFFCVTGCPLVGYETIRDAGDELAAWHRETFPPKPERRQAPRPPSRPASTSTSPSPSCDTEAILTRVLATDKGRRLHDDGDWKRYPEYAGSNQSGADQGLCNLYVAAGADRAQADDLFRRSGLYRNKWDKKHHGDGRTYGEGTLDKAFDGSVRPWDDEAASAPAAPPCHDDRPPPLGVPDDAPCDIRLAAALRELATERRQRIAAEQRAAAAEAELGRWKDRWHREQQIRELPTTKDVADVALSVNWVYESTKDAEETFTRADGQRVFRHTPDGFVRATRGELARKTGKSARTMTTKVARAERLGLIEVKRERERLIDPQTGQIQTIPDSTVLYFRPRDGSFDAMERRAKEITDEDVLAATGKDKLHGGKRERRPVCSDCGPGAPVVEIATTTTEYACGDCGQQLGEPTTETRRRTLQPDEVPEPPGHHDRDQAAPPLEKVAANKTTPTPVVRLSPLDKMTRGLRAPTVPEEPPWLRDAPDDSIAGSWARGRSMPGFAPTPLDQYTDDERFEAAVRRIAALSLDEYLALQPQYANRPRGDDPEPLLAWRAFWAATEIINERERARKVEARGGALPPGFAKLLGQSQGAR